MAVAEIPVRLTFQCCFAGIGGDDVAGSFRVENGDLALIRSQRIHYIERQIFFIGQDAEAFARAIENFSGVAAEEAGCALYFAVDQREILADVMAFETIAPFAGFRGIAKDADVVVIGVAARRWFGNEENFVEAHDGCRLDESALAEAGGEQRHGQLALVRFHIVQSETLAGHGRVEPVGALFVLHLESDGGLLPRLERVDKVLRGGRHDGWRLLLHVCAEQ